MSTKPSTYAQWDSNGTNLSAPTSGHKTDGFATDEIPTSAEINGYFRELSDWTQWLYDGDLTFQSLTLTGITDPPYQFNTNQAPLDPLSTGNTDGLHTIHLDPQSDNLIVHGLASTGTPAGRQVILVNASYSTGYNLFLVNFSSSVTLAQSFTFSGPETLSNTQYLLPTGASVILEYDPQGFWKVIAASGVLRKTRIRSTSYDASIPTGTNVITANARVTLNDTDFVFFPFSLGDNHCYVAGAELVCRKASNTGNTLHMELQKSANDVSGTVTVLGSAHTDNSDRSVTPAIITLSETSVFEQAGTYQYYVVGWDSPNGSTGLDAFFYADLIVWVSY